jgi:hypothetical protein
MGEMATRKTGGKRTVARSSVNGKFVTKSYAKTHKRTTQVETVRKGGGKKR